jgi:hypothetical protein
MCLQPAAAAAPRTPCRRTAARVSPPTRAPSCRRCRRRCCRGVCCSAARSQRPPAQHAVNQAAGRHGRRRARRRQRQPGRDTAVPRVAGLAGERAARACVVVPADAAVAAWHGGLWACAARAGAVAHCPLSARAARHAHALHPHAHSTPQQGPSAAADGARAGRSWLALGNAAGGVTMCDSATGDVAWRAPLANEGWVQQRRGAAALQLLRR